MKGTYRRRVSMVSVLTAFGIALLGVGLLADAKGVGDGVRRGLEMSGDVLIPSLFPFMVLSAFLSLTDTARVLSFPLRPVTTRVFKLPADMGVVLLLSLVGGYPVGAKMIASLLEQGRIDRATAGRMLCFCVNSGPSFLIVAVGAGMFADRTVGIILFVTQTAATLLIGWLVSVRAPHVAATVQHKPMVGGATALVMAVQGATTSILTMCAFAILFSGLQSMLLSSGLIGWLAALLPMDDAFVGAVASGLLEVTGGCIAAAGVGGASGFALASTMVSFSGMSVMFQIFSCFEAGSVRFRPFVLARIAHAGLSTVMALPLYNHFCRYHAVAAGTPLPVMQADANTTLISICLLGMCAIFSLSIGEELQENEVRKKLQTHRFLRYNKGKRNDRERKSCR